jgi:hypothetical protein
MGIDSHLSTCVGTQSPKYLEMAQGHISLSLFTPPSRRLSGTEPEWPEAAVEPFRGASLRTSDQ